VISAYHIAGITAEYHHTWPPNISDDGYSICVKEKSEEIQIEYGLQLVMMYPHP
jgi:hypothetical protein